MKSSENMIDRMINNQYIINKKISAGSFGTVYQVTDKFTNEFYAAKLEENGNSEVLSVLREAKILRKLEGINGVPELVWSG